MFIVKFSSIADVYISFSSNFYVNKFIQNNTGEPICSYIHKFDVIFIKFHILLAGGLHISANTCWGTLAFPSGLQIGFIVMMAVFKKLNHYD